MSETDTRVPRPTSGITPFLAIRDKRATEALDFYTRAFGAEVIEKNVAQDGERLMQASLKINGAWLMLSDEFPEFGFKAKEPASVTMHLQAPDGAQAEDIFNRAAAAGCEVKMPIADQFWGDRYGQLLDPFGHSWSVGGPISGQASV